LLPLLELGHEVIVVDSCPSDNRTATLVSQQFPQITYVLEPCPGTGIARSCGVRAATLEFVAFTDDDAEVDALWLSKLLRNFDDPTVGLVTGLALPMELETPAQLWFEVTNTLSRGCERRVFDLTNLDPLVAGLLGATVNCAFRRSVFESVGYFDHALGPGTPARASDDYEMFYRILAAGYRAVYEPSALVWHHHRRDWKAFVSTVYNYSVSVYAWWTAALLFRSEYGLLRIGSGWFFARYMRQIRDVILRRHGAVPKDVAYAELKGAFMGPYSYFKSKRTMTELLRQLHPPASDVVQARKATAA
jgi:GT2 family glycosyltransferase